MIPVITPDLDPLVWTFDCEGCRRAFDHLAGVPICMPPRGTLVYLKSLCMASFIKRDISLERCGVLDHELKILSI